MDKSVIDKRNFDDVLLRKVIVGVLSYMHERITYRQIANDVESVVKIPFYYSFTGNQQFLEDIFLDTDSYECKDCSDDTIKANGGTIKVPNGILKLKNFSIAKTMLSSQNVRMNTVESEDTDFGKVQNSYSVRTVMIPYTMQFDITIQNSSTINTFKTVESLIKEFYSVRKFFIGEYSGYSMIPVLIGFPDDYALQQLLNFSVGDDNQRRNIDFSIEVVSHLPKQVKGSKYKFNESIKSFAVNASEAQSQ